MGTIARIGVASLAVSLCVLLATPAIAGDVTGRIWLIENGKKRAAAGAEVVVSCKNKGPATANSKGDYRVQGVSTGKCWVHAAYREKKSAKAMLFVSANGASANLELAGSGSSWSLTLK